jgi:hypothetical protein
LKVALTMLSLPGARWRQNNGGVDDARLWTEPEWTTHAERFWSDLASAVRDHPAIVAYNPINEPHPDASGVGHQQISGVGATGLVWTS